MHLQGLVIQILRCSLLVNMFGGRVQITRDDRTREMANNVYEQIAKIIEPHQNKNSVVVDKFAALPLISVEQAMKELVEMENEINKKES